MKVVVIDTNVIFSGLYSSLGASYQILVLVGGGALKPALSVSLFEEYADVLGRPPLSDDFSESEKNGFLDYFCSIAQLTEVFFLWRPFLKDPKDDLVLEVAVASRADTIITHNTKDFRGVDQFGIRAITPVEYLREEKHI